MYFQHSAPIWRDFPALVPVLLYADGITGDAPVGPAADRFAAIAKSRLAAVAAESELPEIQAWRRAFTQMGLKPTQYRCASESLLRRFRKEGSLPRLHPLVDLCNAISLAFAVPVAVLDTSAIAGPLQVRYATGDESYLTFAGEIEHPPAGEVIFAAIGLAREGPGAAVRLGPEDWLAVGYLAVAVTAAAFVMWDSSVRRLGASRAGLLTGVAPVAAAAVGVLLGGPAPRPLVWAGIAVVAAGLAMGLLGRT